MAAIFFLTSLYLKQGIDSVYVMDGSFARANWSCKERESSENNKITNFCPLWDSNPVPSVYEASALPLSHEG